LRAALFSGAIAGFVGPGIGFVVDMRFAFPYFYLPAYWIMAVIAVGPAAFVLGCVGGVVLKALSAKCPTGRAVNAIAAALGLTLGGVVVPFGVFVFGWGAKEKGLWSFAPTGAITGLICTLLILWVLRRRGLLHLRNSSSGAASVTSLL